VNERDHRHQQHENDNNNRYLAWQVKVSMKEEAGDGGSNDERTHIWNCMPPLSGGFGALRHIESEEASLEVSGAAAEGAKRCRATTIASQRTLRWRMQALRFTGVVCPLPVVS